MAIVYDPRTGTLIDDGRGLPKQQVASPRAAAPAQPFFNVQHLPDYGNPGAVPYAQRQAEYNQRQSVPASPPAAAAGPFPDLPDLPAGARAFPDLPDYMPATVPRAPVVDAPSAAARPRNPNATNVGSAIGQAWLGGAALLPAMAADNLRQSATSMVGGDPSTLPGGADRFGNWALGTLADGQQGFTQANRGLLSNLQSGARDLLGVQPAAQPAAPQPALAPQPPTTGPTQDYSAATLGAWGGVTPRPTLVDAALAPAPAAGVPARQTSFDMTNTDRTTLAQRAAPTAGIDFGFGGGGETAQGYLNRMSAQDSQAALQRTQDMALRTEVLRTRDRHAVEGRLASASQSRDPVAIRAARAELAAFDQGNPSTLGGLLSSQTSLAERGMQSEAALAEQAIQSQATLLGQQAAAQATLSAAQIRAGGGVAEAQLKAQLSSRLEVLKAGLKTNTPEGRLAQLKAEQIEAALEAGDLDTATALMGGGRAPQATFAPVTDPITGRVLGAFNTRTGAPTPYDDEQLREGYRASLTNSNRGQ